MAGPSPPTICNCNNFLMLRTRPSDRRENFPDYETAMSINNILEYLQELIRYGKRSVVSTGGKVIGTVNPTVFCCLLS